MLDALRYTFKYYALRLWPHVALFYGMEFLLRLALLVRERANIGAHELGVMLASLGYGLINDSAVFAYALLPFCLYLLLLPRQKHGSRGDQIASTIFYFLLAFIFLFAHASAWLFWEEFQARFNFIAVDYLVYTQEVIANIRESYPVVPVIGGLMGLAALLAYLYARYQRRMLPQIVAQRPALKTRGLAFAASIALALLSFFCASADWPGLQNRYLDEIAKNGSFQFFSAFNNNELDYSKFYLTQPQTEWLPRLQAKLGVTTPLPSAPIARMVAPAGDEKKYNVVLIMVESLSGSYFKTFGNQNNITPNLDRLATDSLFFANLFATGTRTVYGLSSASLGIPPVPGNSVVRKPDNGNLATLGSVLNSKGYVSKFIYGGYGYFDNMNHYFEGNGYQIVDRASFAKQNVTFANAWGVCDEDLFNQTMDENDKTYAEGKPFFDHIMTTSNHRPFTYPAGKIDIPGGRLGGVKYTDYAINKFIEEAKAKPWFKNTIFVIVADHTAGSAGKTELSPDKYHIPLIIYAPGIVKPEQVEAMASQIDLVPTLLGLMNMKYESHFYGVDLMRVHPERAFISNYQKLGYMTPAGLVIIKPVKQAEYYVRTHDADGDDFTLSHDPVPAEMLSDALAYYQGAAQWRIWNKQEDRQP